MYNENTYNVAQFTSDFNSSRSPDQVFENNLKSRQMSWIHCNSNVRDVGPDIFNVF